MTSSCCILRAPPSGPVFEIMPPQESNGTILNPPGVLGETFHAPSFYQNNWGASGSAIMDDSNWNSWIGDPIDKITDQQRITKNTPGKTTGTYYIEYYFANIDQKPILTKAGDYFPGDAAGDPLNIYDAWKQLSIDPNSSSVSGFKYGSVVSSVTYFQFKTYMCRFVYLIGTTDPTIAKKNYALTFLPVEGTNFYKSIQMPNYSLTRTGQNLTNLSTFNSFYAPPGLDQSINEDTWNATPPSTTGLIINMISSDSFQETGTVNIKHAHTFVLDPVKRSDNKPSYGLVPIMSPQLNLEAWITTMQALNVNLVYRGSVRGWMTLLSGQLIPALSNTYVYEVNPKASPAGNGSAFNDVLGNCSASTTEKNCTFTRLTPISGTSSSAPNSNVISYSSISELDFWLLPTDEKGDTVDPAILQLFPRTIGGYVDFQPNVPYVVQNPKYDFQYVFPDSENVKLLGQSLKDLLLSGGKSRFSMNEGQTWSNWASINDISPYINPAMYVGTGQPNKEPGSSIILNAVKQDTFECPDWNGTGKTSYTNDFIEISIPLSNM